MPGLEADTSSYAKLPANPPGVLDTVGKLQGLQQGQQAIQSNAIQIDKQQYDLVKSKWEGISKNFPGLIADPNLNQDKVVQLYKNKVQEGLMTPEMAGTAISQIPPTAGMDSKQATATLQQHLAQRLQQGQTTMEALEFHLPKPELPTIANQQVPSTVSRMPVGAGGGIRQIQPGIPVQLPPGTEQNAPAGATDTQGNPIQQGTPGRMGPVAPGTASGLPVAGAGSILPFKPGTAPPQIQGTGGVPTAGAPGAVKTQSFVPTGNPPMFDAGKAQLAQDQQVATQKSQALIPVLQALPLMKDIMSGPGTEQFTHAIAGLKALGFLSTDTNDPIVARQEVAKKLNGFILGNGQRSDAQQTLTEAASPSPKVQLLPALIHLTQDAIAQERTSISKPGAFNDQDLSKYGQHTTNYPTKVDQQALKIDTLDPGERQKLYDKYSKEVDGKRIQLSTPQAKKFWDTLRIAKQQQLFNVTSGE